MPRPNLAAFRVVDRNQEAAVREDGRKGDFVVEGGQNHSHFHRPPRLRWQPRVAADRREALHGDGTAAAAGHLHRDREVVQAHAAVAVRQVLCARGGAVKDHPRQIPGALARAGPRGALAGPEAVMRVLGGRRQIRASIRVVGGVPQPCHHRCEAVCDRRRREECTACVFPSQRGLLLAFCGSKLPCDPLAATRSALAAALAAALAPGTHPWRAANPNVVEVNRAFSFSGDEGPQVVRQSDHPVRQSWLFLIPSVHLAGLPRCGPALGFKRRDLGHAGLQLLAPEPERLQWRWRQGCRPLAHAARFRVRCVELSLDRVGRERVDLLALLGELSFSMSSGAWRTRIGCRFFSRAHLLEPWLW
mmetsp:Transcript_7423/g.23806  ORF Transcript_7423/g.23806 Transcript_7423/m.23806 type:complete len:361 (-) Transcript_7423:2102-3184(-)